MSITVVLLLVAALIWCHGYRTGRLGANRDSDQIIARLGRELEQERAAWRFETSQWLPILRRLRPISAGLMRIRANSEQGARN